MTSKLLPCPFCGADAHEYKDGTSDVTCMSEGCPAYNFVGDGKKWNERAAPEAPRQSEPIYQVSKGLGEWRDVDLLRYTACSFDPEEYEIRVLYTAPLSPDHSGGAGEVALPEKYDDVILPFVAMMRNELHANSGKGDRAGWLSMTPGECLLEIYYHLGKLQKGVKDGNSLWIAEYAADVANMSMMLADICGCLDKVKELNQ